MMTLASLVVKNLARNRRRTLLTVGSVAVSICLVSAFCAAYRHMDAAPAPGGFHLLLMVTPRTSWTVPLPLHYGNRIASLPGVAAVSPVNMVDGVYGSQNEILWAMASDPEVILKTYTEWQLPPEQRQAFVRERVALLVGRTVAEKHGWKVGDQIHLESANYRVILDLVLRGIYSSREDETMLFFHWDYLNELQGRPDKPGAFWVLAENSDDARRLTRDIDALFSREPMQTLTQPMKQFVLSFLAMLGNVKLILVSISAAVVFAVLLIVANTMGMAIRERASELAVLRALGFGKGQVVGLLTAESLALAIPGAALGCALAAGLLALTAGYQVGGAMPIYVQVDAVTVGVSLAVATVISLASTLLPAYRASRGNIAEALRFVG